MSEQVILNSVANLRAFWCHMAAILNIYSRAAAATTTTTIATTAVTATVYI